MGRSKVRNGKDTGPRGVRGLEKVEGGFAVSVSGVVNAEGSLS